MRLLHNNILNLFPVSILEAEEDDFFPVSNMFNYQTLEVGRFKTDGKASLFVDGKGIINSFAIFNTNVEYLIVEIENIYGKIINYTCTGARHIAVRNSLIS